MNKYIITCSSTADLSKEYLDSRNIPYVCFHFTMDGVEYPDDLGVTVSYKEFYKKISDGATPTTSQINSEDYESFFKKYLDQGLDIIHITLSSGISGTYNSALIAADNLKDKYPKQQLTIIDSLSASAGYGLLVAYAKDNLDNRMDYDDNVEWIMDHRLNVQSHFFSTDLTSFFRGGRISRSSAIFGTALNICPVIDMNSEGKLIPRSKARGKKKAMHQIVLNMVEHAKNGINYDGKCFISESDCLDDAKAVAAEIEELFPKLKGKIVITSIGTVIGSHTGPGTVALFFMGDKRQD